MIPLKKNSVILVRTYSENHNLELQIPHPKRLAIFTIQLADLDQPLVRWRGCDVDQSIPSSVGNTGMLCLLFFGITLICRSVACLDYPASLEGSPIAYR